MPTPDFYLENRLLTINSAIEALKLSIANLPPPTQTVSAVPTSNGLYLNGSTLTLSQTSSMNFGAVTLAGSATMSGLDLTSMTAGSVLVVGSGGVVSQDNGNLGWDSANARHWVGLGMANTFTSLNGTMGGFTTGSRVVTQTFATDNGYSGGWHLFQADPLATVSSGLYPLFGLGIALPQSVTLDNAVAITASAYRLTAGSGSDFGSGSSLKGWQIQGSNDGSSWTTLDTKTAEPTWTKGETRVYSCTPGTYRYWKFTITAAQSGGTGATYWQVMHLDFGTTAATVPSASSKLHIRTGSPTDIGLIIQSGEQAPHTGDLLQFRDWNGNTTFRVDPSGNLMVAANSKVWFANNMYLMSDSYTSTMQMTRGYLGLNASSGSFISGPVRIGDTTLPSTAKLEVVGSILTVGTTGSMTLGSNLAVNGTGSSTIAGSLTVTKNLIVTGTGNTFGGIASINGTNTLSGTLTMGTVTSMRFINGILVSVT